MDYQKIKLPNGIDLTIDLDKKRVACSRCHKLIRWGITDMGRYVPVIEHNEVFRQHLTDCNFRHTSRTNLEDRIKEEDDNQDFINNL